MIELETDTGITGVYIRAYLVFGYTKIDLGGGDSMNERQTALIADELQGAVDKLRLFADRNKTY